VGLLFVGMLGCYIGYSILSERASSRPVDPVSAASGPGAKVFRPDGLLLPLASALGGLILLIAGGNVLVAAATEGARSFGISETVIGLTVIAVGTSLPELSASMIAALRKKPEVAIGNVIGSNVYNMLGIGGLVGIIAPTDIPRDIVLIHNPVMFLATLLVMVFIATGRKLVRTEGLALVALYCIYLFSLGLLA
jgi:cation:H+ antiporter